MLGYYKMHEAMREIKSVNKKWREFTQSNTGIAGDGTIYYLVTDVINFCK